MGEGGKHSGVRWGLGQINEYHWKTTNSSFWREYGWKNTQRFFATPAQRKHGDTKCWWSCGETKANHFHIFWGCSLITQYWKQLKEVIEEVLEIKIPTCFEIMYLGIVETLNLKRRDDYKLLRIMLLASRRAITRRWRCDLVPKVEEWFDVMLNNFILLYKFFFSCFLLFLCS